MKKEERRSLLPDSLARCCEGGTRERDRSVVVGGTGRFTSVSTTRKKEEEEVIVAERGQ